MARCGVHYTAKQAILDDGNDNGRGGLWLLLLEFLGENTVSLFKESKLNLIKCCFWMQGRLAELLDKEELENRIFSYRFTPSCKEDTIYLDI